MFSHFLLILINIFWINVTSNLTPEMKSWVHNIPFPFFSNNIHVCITISWVTAEAFPKNILRCMKEKGVQGLTRDQVASHRQVIAISFLPDLFPSQVCYLVKQSYDFLGEAYMWSTTYYFISKKIQKYHDKLRRINDAPLNTTTSNHLYLSTQQQRALAAGSISLGPNIGTQNFQNISSMSNINTSLASPSHDCDIILEDVLASGDYSSMWNVEFPSVGE